MPSIEHIRPNLNEGSRHVGEDLTENPRPYGEKRLSQAIKEAVPVEKLADDLGAMMGGVGKVMRGRCPIHSGQSRDAFAVYSEESRWHCFRCNEGGDVLDLWMRAKGYFDFKAALIDLAGEYGVQAPQRPRRWHRWQAEKGRRHDALREVRTRLYQRRLLRMFAADLEGIEDPAEREEEARKVYENLYTLARSCAIEREGNARG